MNHPTLRGTNVEKTVPNNTITVTYKRSTGNLVTVTCNLVETLDKGKQRDIKELLESLPAGEPIKWTEHSAPLTDSHRHIKEMAYALICCDEETFFDEITDMNDATYDVDNLWDAMEQIEEGLDYFKYKARVALAAWKVIRG